MSTITRRAVAAALPVAAIAMPICAIAAVEAPDAPDAELLRLREQLSAAWSLETEAGRALGQGAQKDDDDPLCIAHDALIAKTNAIVNKIEALPATTLAGLVVKARACHWCHCGEPIDADFFDESTTDMRLAAGILGDLVAIGRRLA